MVAKIDIDSLKIFFKNQKQIRLKIGKKLKTACLNSRVSGSKKKTVHFDWFTLEKIWNLLLLLT